MNKIVLSCFLLLCLNCSTNSQQAMKDTAVPEVMLPLNPFETISYKEPYNPHSPYHLDLKMETTEAGTKQLSLFITLKDNAYFVSPHAKKDFKGKFSMTIEDSSKLSMTDDIIEIPRSVEEMDTHPFVDGKVNWVRENTLYKQNLNILTKDDFEVTGFIRFTIEPRCTYEEIPFKVTQSSGVLQVTLVAGC
ncbi:hypothetical protein [Xanthomarina gelatinilytica]|uniref:hypothetical protein n=1 Tax=Xanthomarina gelatinilytica TaxID=1137281 RepID=UPI003AA9101E